MENRVYILANAYLSQKREGMKFLLYGLQRCAKAAGTERGFTVLHTQYMQTNTFMRNTETHAPTITLSQHTQVGAVSY